MMLVKCSRYVYIYMSNKSGEFQLIISHLIKDNDNNWEKRV